ncbi:hypothetical protein ACFPM0_13890 [Pseudonocardia sulfidoxydans]|uniref:hypothetical protein n=1 Tax=Pseudonocardia sulfidoxydans TaxID=54011 RepID=UPI003609639A
MVVIHRRSVGRSPQESGAGSRRAAPSGEWHLSGRAQSWAERFAAARPARLRTEQSLADPQRAARKAPRSRTRLGSHEVAT